MNPFGRFFRTEADTPPPGEIPGLRGAPMRTPVRTAGATTAPGLWPAVLVLMERTSTAYPGGMSGRSFAGT